MGAEVTVSKLTSGLDRLQEKVGDAEAQIHSLRQENARLHATIDGTPTPTVSSTARGGRPLRQIVLESERQEIRTRIKNLIEALS
jgi:hypothetical protein